MTYATNKLTASLQSLTRQSSEEGKRARRTLPATIRARQFKVAKDVQSFLEQRSDYAAKSASVRVGSY